MAKRGACFGELAGWERANWYAPTGAAPRYTYAYGRQNWFEQSAAEHRAVREAVGVFDQTSFGKFLIQGADAEAVLQYLCANDVAIAAGKIVYTTMLNQRGGIEADLTVTRLADEAYLIVTGAASQSRDYQWIRRHVPPDKRAVLTDVTSAYAVLGVMGPRSRQLLCALTNDDLSNEAFPFGTSREIDLAYGRVRALRLTYVGELGWELYIPTEFVAGIYDVIVDAGEDFGLIHAGYHALDSLRLEKGYRSWGHDLSPFDTPLEAGLGFAVAFEKTSDFMGRAALLRQRDRGISRHMVIFTLDEQEQLVFGGEPIFHESALVGRITSGGFGHTVRRPIGLGYVALKDGLDTESIVQRRFDVEIAGERIPATPHARPLYDPLGWKIRG